jgi:hypothetical protein
MGHGLKAEQPQNRQATPQHAKSSTPPRQGLAQHDHRQALPSSQPKHGLHDGQHQLGQNKHIDHSQSF